MAYVTQTEYAEITGEPAPSDFTVLSYASDSLIDLHTLFGLVGRDLTALPDYIQQKIKQSAAMQIQYFNQCGGLTAVNDAGYASASLGKFSYSVGYSAEGNMVSPMLNTYLQPVCAYLRGVD